MAIQISGCPVIDNSRNLTNIANATNANTASTFVCRDASGNFTAGIITATSFVGDGSKLTGIKLTCTVAGTSLGTSIDGGFLICKNNGLGLIVSPRCAEVSRTWYNLNDAVVQSGCCTAGTQGWFVPTKAQLQNPGYCCRSFWGPSPCYSSTRYWGITENVADEAYVVHFGYGYAPATGKTNSFCVRAFRCVTY